MKFYFNGSELVDEYQEYAINSDSDFERVIPVIFAKTRRKVEIFGVFEKSTIYGDVWRCFGDYYLVSDERMSEDEQEKYHYMVFTGRW